MINKRGLSAVVTTLIIILLVLVAVGIIWVVVRNLIEGGAESIEINTKCIAVDVRAVSVIETATAGDYDVTLNRRAGGGDIGGIKINIFNDTGSSGVLDFGLAIEELETQTQSVSTGTDGRITTGANRMEFTVFFLDASGNEQLCSQTGEREF